jgi:hypothetical protein
MVFFEKVGDLESHNKKISLMKTLKTILLAGVVSSPLAVFAHAGHGHENPLSPGHYLWNPEHAIPLALTLIVVLFLVGRKFLQIRAKKGGRS